ncbi:MAG: hypothetical protein WDM71_01110 [Ferruginibacter sp.]
MNKELITIINKELGIELPEKISLDELKKDLSIFINQLIQRDFHSLVALLYRIDISETKLKQLLDQMDENAGDIIADLIIERELQKIKSRREFSQRNNNISEEEKW